MDRYELVNLGWDDAWAAQLEATSHVGSLGRISRVERGECDVLIEGDRVRAVSDSHRSQSSTALSLVTG